MPENTTHPAQSELPHLHPNSLSHCHHPSILFQTPTPLHLSQINPRVIVASAQSRIQIRTQTVARKSKPCGEVLPLRTTWNWGTPCVCGPSRGTFCLRSRPDREVGGGARFFSSPTWELRLQRAFASPRANSRGWVVTSAYAGSRSVYVYVRLPFFYTVMATLYTHQNHRSPPP